MAGAGEAAVATTEAAKQAQDSMARANNNAAAAVLQNPSLTSLIPIQQPPASAPPLERREFETQRTAFMDELMKSLMAGDSRRFTALLTGQDPQFEGLLPRPLEQRRAGEVYAQWYQEYLSQMRPLLVGAIAEAANAAQNAVRDILLGGLANNDEMLANLMAHGDSALQQRIEQRFKQEDLNGILSQVTDPTARQDLLRAAMEYGFSAPEVFDAAQNAGEIELMQALVGFAQERMRTLMEEMRDAYTKYEREGTPEARQEYERRLAEVAHLVGPENADRARTQVETQTRETDELIAASIERQLAISAALRGNNLGVIVPPTVDAKRRER